MIGTLLDYAKWTFALTRPEKDTGKSRLQILLEIKAQTGIVAKELKTAPRLPAAGAHIWPWFEDLSRGRSNGMALGAIGWTDMHAYFSLMSIKALRWEVDALRRIDDAFLESRYGRSTAQLTTAQDMMRQIGK